MIAFTDIPPHWCTVSIGEIGRADWGNTSITKKSYVTTGYIAFSAAGPDGYLPNAEFFGPGVVLSAIGAQCGKCFYASGEWASIKNTIVIQTDDDHVSNKYLFYLLNDQRRWHLSGSGQPFITLKTVREKAIPLPPLNEQRRIVAKIEELFSELDKGVESLTTAREQLKAYRQSMLKHAFQGKLTEDWRRLNPDKARAGIAEYLERIRTEVQSRFTAALNDWQRLGKKGPKPAKPASLDNTGSFDFGSLAPLPQGWAYLPFGAIAYTIRNGISKKPNETGALRIFRISAVRPMEFDMSDFRHIDDEVDFENYRLRPGDLVFTRYNGSRAYVGVAAVFRSDEVFVYPDKLIRCDVASPSIDPGYVEKAVNCGESRAFIEGRIRTTAGQAGISGADLKGMPVPICSIDEQVEVNRIVEAQLSRIVHLEREIEARLGQAQALRQSILKRAFSGQLVVQDPADEPASVLLERIRAECEDKPTAKRRNAGNGKKEAA